MRDVQGILKDRAGGELELEELGPDFGGRAALVFERGRDGKMHVHAMAWDPVGKLTAMYLAQSYAAFLEHEMGGSGSAEA